MKEWLRQHPHHPPPGLDATASTSHQLRNGLRRLGWSVQETPNELRLILPGTSASDTTLNAVLGSDDDPEEAETADASFGLEFQLRDFIAPNIGAIDVDGKRLQLNVDPTGRDAAAVAGWMARRRMCRPGSSRPPRVSRLLGSRPVPLP